MDGFGRYWTDLAPFSAKQAYGQCENHYFQYIHGAAHIVHVHLQGTVVGHVCIHVARR